MNPISKALDDIVRFKIPRPILEAAFLRLSNDWWIKNTSLDKAIYDTVIVPRILVDADLIGGTEAFVPLLDVDREMVNDYTSVYYIPKRLTQGRSIISVNNITFNDPTYATTYGAAASGNNSVMLRGAQAMVDAMGTIPVTSTANVQLIAENTVMVRDSILLPANIYLRCQLANDENLSNLQPRSYKYLVKLIQLAVQSYIYNELKIRIDMNELIGGQSLGVFKDIVDSYAESEQMYLDYRDQVMTKVFFLNDREKLTRFIKLKTGTFR
jgi:hypothetical protein